MHTNDGNESSSMKFCHNYIHNHILKYAWENLDMTLYHTISSIVLSGLRYRTYASDEIAIITTALPPVIEITQNHKGYDVLFQTSSCLTNLKCAS